MPRKTLGFIVFETCDDFEQALALDCSEDHYPPDGVLNWRNKKAAHLFPTRQAARQAIDRTHHWAKAFRHDNMPEKQDCIIVPVVAHYRAVAWDEKVKANA